MESSEHGLNGRKIGGSAHEQNQPDMEIVSSLLDALAAGDRETYQAILEEHSELQARYREADATYNLLRRALVDDADVPADPAFEQAAQRTRDELQRLANRRIRASAEQAPAEDSGVLTGLTARLAPAEALALFRRIAPKLALGILSSIGGSARIELVQRVSEHLCTAGALERFRSAEHVRDAILDEIGGVLRDAGLKRRLGRDELTEIMTAGGVMNDLLIMERCIVVARRVA